MYRVLGVGLGDWSCVLLANLDVPIMPVHTMAIWETVCEWGGQRLGRVHVLLQSAVVRASTYPSGLTAWTPTHTETKIKPRKHVSAF